MFVNLQAAACRRRWRVGVLSQGRRALRHAQRIFSGAMPMLIVAARSSCIGGMTLWLPNYLLAGARQQAGRACHQYLPTARLDSRASHDRSRPRSRKPVKRGNGHGQRRACDADASGLPQCATRFRRDLSRLPRPSKRSTARSGVPSRSGMCSAAHVDERMQTPPARCTGIPVAIKDVIDADYPTDSAARRRPRHGMTYRRRQARRHIVIIGKTDLIRLLSSGRPNRTMHPRRFVIRIGGGDLYGAARSAQPAGR